MHHGRGRDWGRGFGPGGPFGPKGPFGPDGPFGPEGPGPRGSRGRRARRGNVRNAILQALATNEMNGYQIIGFIEDKTNGQWRPSPGAIYPALSQLEDERLIAAIDLDGNKAFQLTEAGREQVDAHADQPKPWDFANEEAPYPDTHGALFTEFGQLGFALHAATRSGDDTIATKATEVVAQARRDVYRLLAEADIDPQA